MKNNKAVISVKDYGKGIPESELANIWDRYYTTRMRKGKGVSGLGLAIVRQIVTQHGGKCKAVSEAGGYFEKRNETSAYGKRDVRKLTAVIRIPADKADSFLTGVKGAVNVNSFSKTAENVTEAYIDAEARLQTLEAEREGLLNMISSVDSAAQYDFWYKLHEAISEKEQDIAALKARLRNYDSLVSYSTFELNLVEVKEYTEPEKETFGSRLKTAFIGSWTGFAEGFKDFAVGFVQAFPGLLTFAVISTVIKMFTPDSLLYYLI